MARWTGLMIRRRWLVLGVWLAILGAGFVAAQDLTHRLSNEFSVPGTDSERARTLLEQHFGERNDGGYTVVFRVPGKAGDPATQQRLQALVDRAAAVVPTGRSTPLVAAGPDVLYGGVRSRLHLAEAKGWVAPLRRAIGRPAGTEAWVTGAAAIQHDLDPIFSRDLKKGESIALPIALLVLLAVLGLSWAVAIPFLFAGATIFATLSLVWIAVHAMTTATYVTNLVQLIGLGIAVDYSLLIVYRFREEVAAGRDRDEAIVRTMETAGRAVIFSGATVAIGLALLLFMPLPFMRSIGLGAFLLPLVSIAAAATLQPALLALFGVRGTRRVPVAEPLRRAGVPVPRFAGTKDVDQGFWARLARSIMRRPVLYLVAGGAVLIALALPALRLQLTPGSTYGIPRSPSSVQGFDVLRAAVGPGSIAPTQIVVDAGGPGLALSAANQRAVARLAAALQRDPEVATVVALPVPGRFVDPTGRYQQVVVGGRHDYGEEPTQAFVRRLRTTLIPAAGFPEQTRVLAGGAPPQGVDFLARAYDVFPWLILAVLVLTYLVLLRAFRSVILPLKAVVLNLLSVAAAYGVLVLVFRYGVGNDVAGLYRDPQIEGWIPIFLFAMLFGLSMDYEVFLVSRMREAWDHVHDNERAVAHGLERTGRIITAAAIIMCAAFLGFVAGSIVGLQQFGIGLAVAILLDATLIRAILVPALMAILGRWNWWLPAGVARLIRVPASPVGGEPAARPTGR